MTRVVLAFFGTATLLLGVTSGNAAAQDSQTSALIGTILDPSHAVLIGAPVTISSPQLIGGSRSAQTDDRGTYRFYALAPGVYKITVSRSGFRLATREDIR